MTSMLKFSNSICMSISCFFFLFSGVLSCGTLVSNPKKPGTTGTGGEIQFPNLNFSFPAQIINEPELLTLIGRQNAATLAGSANPKYTTLHKWLQSSHKILSELNSTFSTLNEEKLNSLGGFLQTTSDAALSGIVKKLEPSDASYAYQIRLCYEKKGFLDFKWNETGTKFYIDRNFAYKAIDGKTFNGRSLVVGSLSADGTVLLKVNNGGAMNSLVVDAENADQENTKAAYEAYSTSIYSDKTVEIKGVADWNNIFPKQEEKVTLSADYYMSGKVEKETSWQFVTFNGALSLCNAYDFSEDGADLWQDSSADNYQGWCYGRSSERSLFDFHGSRLNEYFIELESVGIAKQSEIIEVDPEYSFSCDE